MTAPPPAPGHGRRRGELEQQILDCLGSSGQPMTVTAVREALGGDLAYTTVMTSLTRLHTKGILERRRSGRAFIYTLHEKPERAQAAEAARRMHSILWDSDHRSEVIVRFASTLPPEDQRLLRRLLTANGPS